MWILGIIIGDFVDKFEQAVDDFCWRSSETTQREYHTLGSYLSDWSIGRELALKAEALT